MFLPSCVGSLQLNAHSLKNTSYYNPMRTNAALILFTNNYSYISYDVIDRLETLYFFFFSVFIIFGHLVEY